MMFVAAPPVPAKAERILPVGTFEASYSGVRISTVVVTTVSTETSLDGVDMRRIPPVSGRLFLRHVPQDVWEYLGWAELSWRWAFWQDQLHPEDVSDPRINPDGTPGWSTLNLELGGPIGNGSDWRGGLLNILDKHYLRKHGPGAYYGQK